MHSRSFNIAVTLLWLTAMGWLVTAKVLPPLISGDPPSFSSVLAAQKQEPPVGWTLMFNDRVLGWAISETVVQASGITEVLGRVHFDRLPLAEMTGGWVRTVFRAVQDPGDRLRMDARSALLIDPLGRLLRLESKVRLEPYQEVISLVGTVEGQRMELRVRSGDFEYLTTVGVPGEAVLKDGLSPQTQLPNLREGQRWTVPSYSPVRITGSPVEVLQATVEGRAFISWNDAAEEVWLVVYRSDPGEGLGASATVRGKVWVRDDGTILKQQTMLLDSNLTFVRLPPQETAALRARVAARDAAVDDAPEWSAEPLSGVAAITAESGIPLSRLLPSALSLARFAGTTPWIDAARGVAMQWQAGAARWQRGAAPPAARASGNAASAGEAGQ